MLVHLGRSNWQLDGAGGVRDPRGMAGRELAVGIAAVTADEAPVRNLLSVIERCHLEVERLVPSPVASALAVTTEAERAVGILVVDVGGGTTTLAAFQDGALLVVEALPVGGNHMTYDVARALVTTVAEAERIKALYGTLVKAASDASELISYPVQGEEEPTLYQTSKAHVRSVLEPRIEGIFGLIEERLAATGCLASAKGRVVLTGGGAQLLGLDQAWMQRFGGDVRIGRPRPLGRMPASMCSPAFSTVIGLAYARTAVEPGIAAAQRSIDRRGGYLGRMQRWIGEGF